MCSAACIREGVVGPDWEVSAPSSENATVEGGLGKSSPAIASGMGGCDVGGESNMYGITNGATQYHAMLSRWERWGASYRIGKPGDHLTKLVVMSIVASSISSLM